MRRMPYKLIIAAIFVTASFACGKKTSETANTVDNAQAETISITVGRSEARSIQAYIQATGSLVADEISNVAPKVAGKVSDVAVNVGDFVKSGQVIAKLDARDPQLRLAEANASVKQSIAAVRQAEARLGLAANGKFDSSSIPEVRAANANYQVALAELKQASANEKRYRDLVESGDVPMITYEQFRTTRDTAQARVNNAKELLNGAVNTAKQSNQAIRSAEASVEAAKTQVDTAKQALADTVIKAPFSGFVSERNTAVGEYVTSSSTIITLLRSNPIKIQIKISEADVPSVTLGRSVSIQVDAYPDRSFSGVVVAVNPSIDLASRSAIVEATIENADNKLRAGMFGSAKINKEGGSNGVFLPKAAMIRDESTQAYRAFVIEDGVAKLHVVQPGNEEGDSVQVLSGLEADKIVATSNLDKLYEGAKVVY
jgi:multidrug resistance efflux pump